MRHFIFCHGFGFDKNFWSKLAPFFNAEKCTYLDLGYFEMTQNQLDIGGDDELIGLGHSLGLLKLLQLKKDFSALIGLNSFLNFLGCDTKMHAQRTKELNAFSLSLRENPAQTLLRFRRSCGISLPLPQKEIRLSALFADLDLLFTNSIPPSTQTLILGAEDDIITPPSLLYDNFCANSSTKVIITTTGSHALGFLEANYVYQSIMKFLHEKI